MEEQTKGQKYWSLFLDLAQTIVIFLALYAVIHWFLFRPFQVSGSSMYPFLHDKEYLITSIIGLRLSEPKLGDIIVFKAPNDPNRDFVKRVIGTPGDTVSIREGKVYRNNQLLDESEYLDNSVITTGSAFLGEEESITVPEDNFFVMGDNRSFSSDSREWGFVPKKNIVGESILIYLPLNRAGFIQNPF